MGLRIDKNKSIKFKRIIFKTDWESILNLLYEVTFYSILPLIIIFLTFKSLEKISLIGLAFIIIFCSIYFTSWFLLGMLCRVKINDKIKDRDFLVETFSSAFPELPIIDNGINSIIAKRMGGFPITGRCLTILFDEEYAYINLTSYGKFESRSFLHSIGNYFKIKNVINDYKLFSNGN